MGSSGHRGADAGIPAGGRPSLHPRQHPCRCQKALLKLSLYTTPCSEHRWHSINGHTAGWEMIRVCFRTRPGILKLSAKAQALSCWSSQKIGTAGALRRCSQIPRLISPMRKRTSHEEVDVRAYDPNSLQMLQYDPQAPGARSSSYSPSKLKLGSSEQQPPVFPTPPAPGNHHCPLCLYGF